MTDQEQALAVLTVVAVVVAIGLGWVNIRITKSQVAKALTFAGAIGSAALALFTLADLAQKVISG